MVRQASIFDHEMVFDLRYTIIRNYTPKFRTSNIEFEIKLIRIAKNKYDINSSSFFQWDDEKEKKKPLEQYVHSVNPNKCTSISKKLILSRGLLSPAQQSRG